VPDDIGYPKRPPKKPGDEPLDLTALYQDEEVPPTHRRALPRREAWKVEPKRRTEPDEDEEAGTEPGEAAEGEQRDEQRQEPAETPEQTRWRRRKRLIIVALVAMVLLTGAAWFGWYWYTTLRWLESTDDAYTQADNTVISPKVGGYVSRLLVGDNQVVKQGQLLLEIDPRDYKAAVDQAQADVNSAEANIRNIDAQINLQQAVIAQAQADIASAESALTFAQQENARYQELVRTGAGTVQRAQQAAADLREKTATLAHNHATLDQAQKQVAVLRTQRGVAEATLQHNRAVLDQAKLNLGYTSITSPIDGAVGDRSVRVGQYVQPGAQLMTIVPMARGIYVVANFKETQIRRMFRGQRADITIDTFPGVRLRGTVDSLAPGSGAQFALLPPENATGNFTKIVQRVPVKILFDQPDSPVLAQLRPGLSVVATVDLRTTPANGAQTLVPTAPSAR
jgi:membrane fusion protein (multidrug efflux system)